MVEGTLRGEPFNRVTQDFQGFAPNFNIDAPLDVVLAKRVRCADGES